MADRPTPPPDPQSRTRFNLQVPDDVASGAYANFLHVWHTPHEFTLDFGALQQPRRTEDAASGGAVTEVPVRTTARVKVPPSVVFDIIRVLNQNLTNYESRYGPVERPGQGRRDVPPDDVIGTDEP